MKRKRLLKLCISLCLIVLILLYVDVGAVLRLLREIPAWVVLTVLIGYSLGQVVSSYKWWLIAKEGGVQSSFPNALKSYFIGMFVNSFGLGVVGGDLTRALLLANGSNSKATALGSVAADRIQGLSVLLGMGCSFALLNGASGFQLPTLLLFVVLLLLVSLSWVYGPTLSLKVFRSNETISRTIENTSKGFPQSFSCISSITIISLCFHSFQIFLHWIICIGLGAPIPLAVLFATIPFINIFSSLPISWNGLGVREGGYLFFLTPLYLTQEQVIAMGALWLLAATISSALGGVISFITRDEKINSLLAANGDPA